MPHKPSLELTDVQSPYRPTAIYLDDADAVEYVKRDVPCIYRRIDGILTLTLDMKSRDLIGFRLKGFRNLFLTHLKPKYRLLDDDFIPLVSVIEQAVQIVGDDITHDPKRRKAYSEAKKMAHEDRVAIEPIAA
jgi:hypothetical protein